MSLRIRPSLNAALLEVALTHHRAAEAHHRRAVAAAGDHLEDLLPRQAGPLAEHDRLGQRRHLDAHQHVEDELHGRAHAALAEVGHLLADRLEDVLDRLEVRLVAAHHHAQLALRACIGCPEHAGVERPVARLRAPAPASSRAKSGGTVLMSTM